MITIRIATTKDLPAIMEIVDSAREFMIQSGNVKQWINGYPSKELMHENIEKGYCYICISSNNEPVGTFCWIIGEDPTYKLIEDGEWLNKEPYGVIHRMASNGKVRGVAQACITWCLSKEKNIRVDTHHDNLIMQKILEKSGFTRCGIIYVSNGTPRIAYQTRQ
ncbi:MAG: GNAT family N-acetyltransferase [Phocaeicola sp.]